MTSSSGEKDFLEYLYFRDIKHDLLSDKRIHELCCQMKTGSRKARDEFVCHNLRLVISIARRHSRNGNLMDLISEGNLGLIRAVEKFDIGRGVRFSTHATWWIRQAILRALGYKGRTIRLPIHIIDKLSRVSKVRGELEQRLNRTPTIEEIAAEIEEDSEKVRSWLQAERNTQSLSLDETLDSHSGKTDTYPNTTYLDLIEDNMLSPAKLAEAKDELRELNEKVRRALQRLFLIKRISPRNLKMFRVRWPLNGNIIVMTLDKASQQFGVSRERIRQIEAKCLRLLAWCGHDFGGIRGWEQIISRIYELSEIVSEPISLWPITSH